MRSADPLRFDTSLEKVQNEVRQKKMTEPARADITPPVPAIAKGDGVEDCAVVIKGIRWRYLHAGSGPALLLVHGFMGYSFSWRFVIQGLARHYSVYAVDLPGCGFSQRCTTLPGTLTSDAEHLLNFMDHMGIEQFDVLGTSRGGGATIVLADLAAQRKMLHRIRRLVLSAPINPWSKIGLLRIRLLRTRGGRTFILHLAPRMPFILKSFFRDLYADPASIPLNSFAGYQAGLEPAGSFLHLWNIARSWTNDLAQIGAVLAQVESVPALLLWGDHDRAVAPASVHELHHRWKNSAVVMMARVGHMPYEEVPAEFNRIVLDFLLRGTPATPLQQVAPAALAQTTAEPGRA
ncbi:MAG TPA: alpha/beta fold hydrolase [Candidatus Eisenbacteria bacterium]|nr:alpha/beta fold hydrolase [Candidatus Eisenbacteria bacterium]